MDVLRQDGAITAVRIADTEFHCEDETGVVHVPKALLHGIRLSEIPDGLVLKPVESIADNAISININMGLTPFVGGRACALIEEMQRRKFWDEDVGLSKHIGALRQAIAEHPQVRESDFDDDGDYLFLHYDVIILEDLFLEEAIGYVERIVAALEERCAQILARRVDPLTKVFDRGTFDAEICHAFTSGTPCALLLGDIDHFKQVNDSYGHQAGDVVLTAVAGALAQALEGIGIAYRYGGEELAGLLRYKEAEHVVQVAERIRTAVAALVFEDHLRVTMSIGVAMAPQHGEGPDTLIKNADTALYEAKQAGRNAVRVSP